MLHVSGRQLYDEFGNLVFLTSINVHRNERRRDGGVYWTVDDIRRIKEAGGNCVELHAERLSGWMPEKNLVDESYAPPPPLTMLPFIIIAGALLLYWVG